MERPSFRLKAGYRSPSRENRLLRLKNAGLSKKKALEAISSGSRYFAEAVSLETTDILLTVSLQKPYK